LDYEKLFNVLPAIGKIYVPEKQRNHTKSVLKMIVFFNTVLFSLD